MNRPSYWRIAFLGLTFAAIIALGIAIGVVILFSWAHAVDAAQQHFYIR